MGVKLDFLKVRDIVLKLGPKFSCLGSNSQTTTDILDIIGDRQLLGKLCLKKILIKLIPML